MKPGKPRPSSRNAKKLYRRLKVFKSQQRHAFDAKKSSVFVSSEDGKKILFWLFLEQRKKLMSAGNFEVVVSGAVYLVFFFLSVSLSHRGSHQADNTLILPDGD